MTVKQLVCVKWGTMYGPEYVNRLYGMVSRHITPPFRLVCLTDDRTGIRPEVECFDLPELGVPHPQRTMGKWRKQILWGRSVPGLEGVALFVDLDSVIVGPLDDYFEHRRPGRCVRGTQLGAAAGKAGPDLGVPLSGGRQCPCAGRLPRRPAGHRRQVPVRAALRDACGHRRREVLARGLDARISACTACRRSRCATS